MDITWIPLALLGAFIYGMYSLLLDCVAPEIKGNQEAQVGYGLTLGLARIPVALILYWLWARKQKTGKLVLHKYINWKIILLTLVFGCLIDPVHTLVVNAGGSVGHQTMFSLSIIPVIVGGYFLFHKHLTIKKWIGIVVSCAGMWLMST
jgi:drug/metabolite transporter (DMT)-like permease